MKRFIVFIYEDFSPSGGAEDYKGSADNLDEILEILDETIKDEVFDTDLYMNVLDTKTKTIIIGEKVYNVPIWKDNYFNQKGIYIISREINRLVKDDE